MVKVTFYQYKNQSFKGFDAYDHAGYDEDGQDIVCAGVSALTTNFTNSLEELTKDSFTCDVDQEQGKMSVRFQDELSDDGSLLLRSLIIGLTSIEEVYNQYVDVVFEEV